MYNLRKRLIGIFLILLLFIIIFESYMYYHFPSQIEIIEGEKSDFKISFPFTIDNIGKLEKIIILKRKYDKDILKKRYEIQSLTKGKSNIKIKLLGFLPLKNIEVNVIDKVYLMPGGHSIGVKLDTKGVIVVAFSDIIGQDGKKHNPAKEAGIKKGDVILEINGVKVKDSDHVIELLNNTKNETINVKIERKGKIFTTEVKLVKNKDEKQFKLGAWIRDKTAGIGTLTFFDPKTKIFGALGHGITDLDTGFLLPVENGQIMTARVSSVQQGKKGLPGELRGIFFESEDKIGEIEKNTKFGIYGVLQKDISNNLYNKPLPIGLQSEVREGKAYILTTIEDEKINKFEVEIIKAQRQLVPSQKSMIIKVTDKKLLKKTGGIVQGMSGSPIIQDGKIIGAVTHVFINDPTKGYGLYIEWMLKQSGIKYTNNKEFAQVN
ncbi:SpoIVB peptidase [Caloranaerobacter ferrireducens]|uniref:SpoIVB peptidase n=1 Tax=Caloranaerobacter ferrireducens TaxID=1323370 RepID=UPI00084D3B9C|nr:SpoIVB peptidase [Caloranaerobacter ferrireducens]